MPSPKPKLLVVEDDPANLELMSELLQQLESEVRPIADPIVIVTGKQEQDVMHFFFLCRGHLLPSQADRQSKIVWSSGKS
jgi:hypothetical protein